MQPNSMRLLEDLNKQYNIMKSQTLISRKYLECSLKLEKSENSLTMLKVRETKNYILGLVNITNQLET